MRIPSAKEILDKPTEWAQQTGIRRIQYRQWTDADATELQGLASPAPTHQPTYLDDDEEEESPISYKRTLDGHHYENVNLEEDARQPKHQPPERSLYTHGWRFGTINCAISVTVVFIINLVVTIWGSVHENAHDETLIEGDCNYIRKTNTGLHLLINLLSTILLSSSNYCMQILSAPTRPEVDQSHAKGIWLDIGVPSVRNIRHIDRRRVYLWALLGLSSLPLHLFYNSMVFATIATHEYERLSVSQAFIDDPECLNCKNMSFYGYYYHNPPTAKILAVENLHKMARAGSLDYLSGSDCIDAYAQDINTSRRNLILVAAEDKVDPINNRTGSHVYGLSSEGRRSSPDTEVFSWICDMPWEKCRGNLPAIKSRVDNWVVDKFPIDHCLSEQAPQFCKLQFSLPIAIVVTILNFVKAAIIYYTAFRTTTDPLLTMGDAVSSFLQYPDPTTKNMCLVSIHDMKKHKYDGTFPAGPKAWSGRIRRWKDVTSRARRITVLVLFVSTLTLCLGLLIFAVQELAARNQPSAIELGFGSINPATIIIWDLQSTIENVLIANLPQPVLSMVYFSYNGLFTCMLLGLEWSTYSHERKGLRVSRLPRGNQRSTYFLQLPYRFALPLMILSGILHWLVSQSIFLVAMDAYDSTGQPADAGKMKSCGFSPMAIIAVIVLGFCMVCIGVGFGFMKYKPGVNMVGSCSAAISAACHHKEWDHVDGTDASGEKLSWGVVGGTEDGVGHCAFSSQEVKPLIPGVLYSGGEQCVLNPTDSPLGTEDRKNV